MLARTQFRKRSILLGSCKDSILIRTGEDRLEAGRGPTRLRARVRNRDRLENRSHVVPKTEFQDGGGRTRRSPHFSIIATSHWLHPQVSHYSAVYSQNHHFGLVYDMIYQFLGMEAKNYKFGMFCQQCHQSVASVDADIRPRNASRIHTCHLFTS